MVKTAQHYYIKNQKKKPSNVYKTGRLTRSSRISRKKLDKKWLIVIGCVIFSFVFAIILGNILGNVARDSQSAINNAGSPSSLGTPSVDKTSPKAELHAYYADMSGADPNVSLSEQTGSARERGNALYFEITSGGRLIYSSSKAEELGYAQSENLTLSRLNNHFDYYNDYAVGLFKSEFSAELDAESRIDVQGKDALLLREATESAFDQIIVEFSGELHRYNAIYYQTYLLNLKLACEGVPIGVKLPYSFFTSSSNSGLVSELLSIADFCAVDLGSQSAEELKSNLDALVYFTERYGALVMLDTGDEATLNERILALESEGIKNYVIK